MLLPLNLSTYQMNNFTFSPYPSVYYAHLTGALVTFTGGIISAGLQAALTRLMHPEIVEMSLTLDSISLNITMTVCEKSHL